MSDENAEIFDWMHTNEIEVFIISRTGEATLVDKGLDWEYVYTVIKEDDDE